MKKKFPVVSKSGNTYQVKIFFVDDWYAEELDSMRVNIYKQINGLFGIKRMKKLEQFKIHRTKKEYLSKHNYIHIAKTFVSKYEIDNEEELYFKKRLKRISKEFDEWDGQC